MRLQWRPLRLSDAPELVRLLAEVEAAEPAEGVPAQADVVDHLTRPGLDLAEGSTSVWAGDRLVGYATAQVRPSADPVHLLVVGFQLAPDHRTPELSGELARWCETTGRRLHAESHPGVPLHLYLRVPEGQKWLTEVAEVAGYRNERTYLRMRVALGELPELPEPPADLRPVPFEPRLDEATRLANNEIFTEHWGIIPQSPEVWRHGTTGNRAFRPDLTFVVLAPDDTVLAFLTGLVHGDEVYFGDIGTRAELRGRGAATGLVGHALRAARDAGLATAALTVDRDNPGALRIYQRCGFEVVHEVRNFILRVS
ncbi:GNAT family N-acetyltransferase [Amycolatopsis suaedae]|uniref:GNAT family N-acetyltransferase n=1 Tax=Amycolatopsis suaedae TaxID=2510978 RepID=A0A4Q7JEK1_9PSEU|nr:GNAT family N-acetyltransferase [Amycolatopsis suaedae]RZQ64854.1 GNAT family N-acetyltransferase [Amycolatopsis suaedae]